jgi:hypothetical protein
VSSPRTSAIKTLPVQTIGYTLRDSRYLNITNRCTLRCEFCPKFNGMWAVQDYQLRLDHEPTLEEIVAAAGNPEDYREIVFCGRANRHCACTRCSKPPRASGIAPTHPAEYRRSGQSGVWA